MLELKTEENKMFSDEIDGNFGGVLDNANFQGGFYQKREILRLPPSAKFILFLLKIKGPLNRKRIIQETMMPDRTVGFALKKLLEKNLIQKVDLDVSPHSGSQKRRRNRRKDRRITNYNIIPSVLPLNLTNF